MINLFEEGTYFDMWTVPHFLLGFLTFVFLVDRKIRVNHAILITVAIAIFWEFFEMRVRVEEVLSNRYSDVIISVVGFYILYFINKKTNFMLDPAKKDTVWRYTLGIWILINALGWMSYAFL